jgi:hypothetical protein
MGRDRRLGEASADYGPAGGTHDTPQVISLIANIAMTSTCPADEIYPLVIATRRSSLGSTVGQDGGSKMNWMRIEGEELERLKLTIDKAAVAKTDQLAASRMSPPFYRNGNLLNIVAEVGSEIGYGSMVETGDGALIPLDGGAEQIGVANRMAGLHLNMSNVIHYAIFFCEFLRVGDGGNFPFVAQRGSWALDTGRMPEDLEPRVETMDGGYLINAYVTHAGMMFAVKLEIRNDGVVEMVDDEPLGRIVSFQ